MNKLRQQNKWKMMSTNYRSDNAGDEEITGQNDVERINV